MDRLPEKFPRLPTGPELRGPHNLSRLPGRLYVGHCNRVGAAGQRPVDDAGVGLAHPNERRYAHHVGGAGKAHYLSEVDGAVFGFQPDGIEAGLPQVLDQVAVHRAEAYGYDGPIGIGKLSLHRIGSVGRQFVPHVGFATYRRLGAVLHRRGM
jgi:hypothetical protein